MTHSLAPENKERENSLERRLDGFRPTLEMLRLVAAIDEFKGAWRTWRAIAPERLTALRRVATVESVGSSTRIEGVQMTNAQIDALLSGLDIRAFRSRDEEEVAGYADLMETVFQSWEDLPLTENHVKQLHGILLRHSGKDARHQDARHRGHYKTLPNSVEAFGPDGQSLGVVFETVSPFATPFAMTELVSWTRDALEARVLHPLLAIGIFVVRFLAIHPFGDGNGRLSRALTTLLLLRAGYAYVPYSSLESVIEDTKEAYYRALRLTQASQNAEAGTNWEPWLRYFLTALHAQKSRLEAKLAREGVMEGSLPALSVQILEMARQRGRVQMADVLAATGQARGTIRNRLNELVARGLLARHGQGPATWYVPG